jgi:hypothetical protein
MSKEAASNLPTTQEIAETAKIACVSCSHLTNESYCEQCGQRKQSRFTLSYIFGELFKVLNYDKGFLHNFHSLTFAPYQTIWGYLNGKTKRFYPPLPYYLTSITILVLLLLVGAKNIDVSFAEKINFIINDKEIKAYTDQIKQEKTEQPRRKVMLGLLAEIDSLEYWQLQHEGKDKVRALQDSAFYHLLWQSSNPNLISKEREIESLILFAAYYFMPVYLAFFAWLFYRKTKLFFTEQLVIQLFGLAQVFWFLNLAVLLVLGFSWAYKQMMHIENLPPNLVSLQFYVIFATLFAGLTCLYYVYLRCYRQHWLLTFVKFVPQIFLTLLTALVLSASVNEVAQYFLKK